MYVCLRLQLYWFHAWKSTHTHRQVFSTNIDLRNLKLVTALSATLILNTLGRAFPFI